MIKNQLQYGVAQTQVGRFEAALTSSAHDAPTGTHPMMWKAYREGLESQLSTLRREIAEYDALRSGAIKNIEVQSLDELPQFFNILAGQMSLVGPRPIVVAEAARYGRWFKVYCSNRPGLTGLWQVSGRNNVDYRRRVALDVMFARRRSLRLYFGVLLATVPSVLKRDGSY